MAGHSGFEDYLPTLHGAREIHALVWKLTRQAVQLIPGHEGKVAPAHQLAPRRHKAARAHLLGLG